MPAMKDDPHNERCRPVHRHPKRLQQPVLTRIMRQSSISAYRPAKSTAIALCNGFVQNFDDCADVLKARQSLVDGFLETELHGHSECGFVSNFGFIRITAKENTVTEIVFTDELCPLEPRGPLAVAALWLTEYFAGKHPEWRFPTRENGSRIYAEVCSRVDRIPYGETSTYGAIQKSILAAFPESTVTPRNVGQAVGRNRLAIYHPCHRVVGADGSLTGFAWGLERKKALLEFERQTV